MLPDSLPLPPKGLLPDDALVSRVKFKQGLQLTAETFAETIAEAQAAGLESPPSWRGLGEIPGCLRKGFRSLLVLGPSGSGKSTLLAALIKDLFPSYSGPLYPSGSWRRGRAIIEAFETADRGRNALSSVGLSSVPSWCKPFEVLSVGEKYRANIAQALQQRNGDPSHPIVFDEWTSELNRSLAQVISAALSKRMRVEAAAAGAAQGDEKPKLVQGGKPPAALAAADVPGQVGPKEWKGMGREEGGPQSEEAGGDGAEVEAGEALEAKRRRTCSAGPQQEEEPVRAPGMEEEDHAGQEEARGEAVAVALQRGLGGEDERAGSTSHPKEQAEEGKGEAPSPPGPFIFASCCEDVVAYLQPEFICLCAVGKAPRAFRNKSAGSSAELRSELRGDWTPVPIHGGVHSMLGHWTPQSTVLWPFKIGYYTKSSVTPLRLHFDGEAGDPGLLLWESDTCDWYTSAAAYPECGKIRVRGVDKLTLAVQCQEGNGNWGTEFRAVRRVLPLAEQARMLARNPMTVSMSSGYEDYDPALLKSHGWYLPPELALDRRYPGLARRQDPQLVSPMNFRFKASCEEQEEKQRILSTYVGEPDGSLSAQLHEVSWLLQCPFDGLCVHKIPKFPPIRSFSIGVITGPSGSGKSTLAKHVFGLSPTVAWAPDAPVLGHFDSLAGAREFLEVACLDLDLAMRPFGSLSRGEQMRAELARLLHRAAGLPGGASGASAPGPALVLDEFTSLVDRPLARRMAQGVQGLVRRRCLRRIVVVSCHDDLVGKGLLEPDWLFECHNDRLLRFTSGIATATVQGETPLRGGPKPAKSGPAQAEAGVPAKKLVACGRQEVLQVRPLPALAPPVQTLEIRRALPREWLHFRDHHYKDHNLFSSCIVFVGTLGDRAVCFLAMIYEPKNWVQEHNTRRPKWASCGYPAPWALSPTRKLYREHRTVVLPDFQGMGLASLLCDSVAWHCFRAGHDFTSQTVHPTYGSYRDRSPFWRALPTNGQRDKINGNFKFSHFFTGPVRPDGTHDECLAAQLNRRITQRQ